MLDQLDQHPNVKRIVFDASELGSWDSSLPIFFFEISKLAAKKKTEVQKEGLPAGVRQLIDLATAVPKKGGCEPNRQPGRVLYGRVGSEVCRFCQVGRRTGRLHRSRLRGFFSNDYGSRPVQGLRPGALSPGGGCSGRSQLFPSSAFWSV